MDTRNKPDLAKILVKKNSDMAIFLQNLVI